MLPLSSPPCSSSSSSSTTFPSSSIAAEGINNFGGINAIVATDMITTTMDSSSTITAAAATACNPFYGSVPSLLPIITAPSASPSSHSNDTPPHHHSSTTNTSAIIHHHHRPSILRPFHSLSSLHSTASTNEALAAMESTTLVSEPPPIDSPMMGHSPPDELEEHQTVVTHHHHHLNTDWRSIYICAFLAFCSVVQFSLYFSSMWPYFRVVSLQGKTYANLYKKAQLDESATEQFFGYIVASYSLGQIIGSPIAGFLSNRLRKIRQLLYVGLLLMFTGNAIYLCVHLFERNMRRYLLILARFVTGIGSSNTSLLKAYASTASTTEDRSRAIAWVTGGVALGQTMGPAFQLLFTPFGFPGFRIIPGLHLSMYTAPALMACIMNALNALCIFTLFHEIYAGVINAEHEKMEGSNASGLPPVLLPKPDRKSVLLCYLTRFCQMFVNTNLETLSAPLAMMMFAWNRFEAVKYIAIAQGAMSLLAFLTYIAFIVLRLDKIINFRVILMCSLFGLILFHAPTYSYPFLPGHVQTFSSAENHTGEQVGCDVARFDWCPSVRPFSPWYFYACYVILIGLAFANINITLNTLFSKIIGPRRQGTQQGILQMCGASARMIGPVVISTLYDSFGPQSAWLTEIAVCATTLSLWFVMYRRMVPLALPYHLPYVRPTTSAHKAPNSHDSEPTIIKRRSSRNRRIAAEERKPLVDPIEEEPDFDDQAEQETQDEERGREEGGGRGDGGSGAHRQRDHTATISTMATMVDDDDAIVADGNRRRKQ